MRSDAGRYKSDVDISVKNSSQAQLVLLTGRNKRVLEVGPATGYVTEVLRSRGCQVTAIEMDPVAAEIAGEFCERIIVGDIEQIDLAQTFGEEQFDVVMFGDVLEHLVDPKGILEKVCPLLRTGGYVVASIPNVAHASVRLMLLDGQFVYSEQGLLDHTHLRFFAKSGVKTLFEEAGYRIRVWRHIRTDTLQDPFAGESSLRESELPPLLVKALQEDPEALTYQFVVRAYPRRAKRLNKRGSQRVPESTDGVGNAVKALWHLEEVLTQKDRDIAHTEAALTEKDGLMAEKDGLLAEKDTALDQKDAALAQKDSHVANIEAALHNASAQAASSNRQLEQIRNSVGYRLLERVRRPIRWLAPEGTRRRGVLRLFRQGLRIVHTEGWGTFLRRAVPVWRWAPRIMRRARLAPQVGPLDEQYQLWLQAHALTRARIRRVRKEGANWPYQPLVSIIMPVYNTDPAWLLDAIQSVRGQLYDNWELCIADDGSTRPDVRDLLDQQAKAEQRIKVTYLKKNQGIAAASNAALALATGEFVGLLDHDDELKPDALFEVVRLLNERRDLDYVYSDEDKKDPDGRLVEPFFKPDWSPDLHMSINYVTHFSVFRKELVDRVGGFRSGYDGSQDYDLVLRVTEVTDKVAHIAKPLYTWRKSPGSAASSLTAKGFAYRAAKRALKDALTRRGLKGKVEDGSWKGSYRVKYGIAGNPKVSIIIPTRDRVDMLRRCVDSIERKSSHSNYEIIIVDNDSQEQETLDYLSSFKGKVMTYPHEFNFARMINMAARKADGEALLFLNNDTEVISAEWMEAMLEHGQRPQVAAVGARLLYPDGQPQHEGIIMGLGTGSALNADHGGYFGLGECIHNCSAVTAACMLTRPSVFQELGGFDEHLRVAFNDVDFCLRAQEKGYRIVYTPFATLYHHESASRGSLHPHEDEKFFRARWGKPGEYRDPYYNPNLDLRHPFSPSL